MGKGRSGVSDEENPSEDREGVPAPVELVLITGLSGAGRSEAIHTFEDQGYFCIDNLPPALLGQVVALAQLPGSRFDRIAVVCDMRSKELFKRLAGELHALKDEGQQVRILFIEAAERVIVNRFKTTRRRHPLAGEGSIASAVRVEREALAAIRDQADLVIDTSEMSPPQLREAIRRQFISSNPRDALSVTVQSFGFKHGLPIDADIVMDVRFLPNPFYIARLRHKTGLDSAVRKYVLGRQETGAFLARWYPMLDDLLPNYVLEGKHHLSIAMGCTGGQHRSVVLAEETNRHLAALDYDVAVTHRDIRRSKDVS
jgi:UPF0042 nucleotide-binding protein